RPPSTRGTLTRPAPSPTRRSSDLLAQPLDGDRLGRARGLAEPLGGKPGLVAEVGDDRVDRAAAEGEAGAERAPDAGLNLGRGTPDRKSTRLNSSHSQNRYRVFRR